MKYLIDSSAWIEYLKGSEKGEKVNKVLSGENEIFVIPLNIGEVISKVKRENQNIQIAYNTLTSNSKLIQVSAEIAKDSGVFHAEERKKGSSMSLADALIIKTAEKLGLKVLTTDNHFKNLKNAEII